LEEKPNHYDIFLRERTIYNLTILNPELEGLQTNESILFRLKKIILNLSAVAAIFLLSFLCYHLWNNPGTNEEDRRMAFQAISVPLGQRVNLELPDGSRVWLNGGTTIKYPVSFNESKREVLLEGEAYFEIEKNEELPFHVVAGDHTVEVLGTKFSVQVDPAGERFETLLLEGSVKIFHFLTPGRSVTLEPNTGAFLVNGCLQVKPVTNFDNLLWREGFLCFEKSRFGDIMSNFEKYFGYQIIISNQEVHEHLYTGKFRQTDGIDYALNLLQKNICFTYSRIKDENTIVIE